jgi:hypothetical protein
MGPLGGVGGLEITGRISTAHTLSFRDWALRLWTCQ